MLCSGSLQSAQVHHNDLLMLVPRQAPQRQQSQPQPQAQAQQPSAKNRDGSLQNPQAFLAAALNNPAQMAQFPPALRDAVSSGDVESIQRVFRQLARQAEEQRMVDQLIKPGEDPFDAAVQVHCS